MNKKNTMSIVEFVVMLASLTALGAMSTDAMLPALGSIGQDLGIKDPNGIQFIISSVFAGFAIGQLFYGPLSDSIGRKKAIYISLSIFILGSFVSMGSQSFYVMLLGRFLQGFGASGSKIIPIALIRDKFHGREMAKIMSFISVVFILVPAIAPMIGGFILRYGNWHHIFLLFVVSASFSFIWFGLRQEETLPLDKRQALNVKTVNGDIVQAIKNRKTFLYTVVLGFIFGAFVSYLSTAEQIFVTQYNLGEKFPLYFALNALALGSASLVNARLVEKYGMRFLSKRALETFLSITAIYLYVAFSTNGKPSLWAFMLFCMVSFFSIGILFGNLNTLAMEPMGKIAGTAASLVGAGSMFIALPIGITIGQFYNNSITPMVVGFTIVGIIAYSIFRIVE